MNASGLQELPRPLILCHGCFDLLHLGHIRHLEEAADLGKTLIVSVTADRYVNKGPGRPQFTAEQRAEALRSLGVVDVVIVNNSPSAVDAIKAIKPDVYVKGIDYAVKPDDPGLVAERRAVEEVGGRLHVTTAAKYLSPELLRGIRLPDTTLAYLETARQRGFLDQILTAIEAADELKITFVGEHIVDEYVYVNPLSKPPKESVLATVVDRFFDDKDQVIENREVFDGGVLAACKHADWRHDVLPSWSSIKKTRYVDKAFRRKLFEVYSSRTIEPHAGKLYGFKQELSRVCARSDVVIVIDFGHGLFDDEAREIITKKAKFLALNSQTNAANFGFNPVTRFKRADYICIDEPEARLATGIQWDYVQGVAYTLAGRMGADNLVVTRGSNGCVSWRLEGHTEEIPPVVSGPVVDTMGAGDAFLAVSAPLVAVGLPIELAAFAGNVAGGLKTTILGHRDHVSREDLVKNLEWLLK